MKVAFDAYPMASQSMSGVGIHALNIAKQICLSKKVDCELLLYDFLRHHHSKSILQSRVPDTVIRQNNIIPYGAYVELWEFLPLSYNTLFRSHADIYHFFNFVVPPKVKGHVINTVHDLVFYTYPETMEKSNYRRMIKNVDRSCEMSDIIITVSENGKRELRSILGIPESKIRVVYNGVDHNLFNPGAPDSDMDLPQDYILYIGTLEPRKNLITLLKAYALTKAHQDGCSLVIAGSKGWEYEEIFRIAENLGIEVTFTGYVPSEKLPGLYKNAKAFAFPSLYEGFGIPPLEAMACGTPVVSTLSSSLPEVVGDAALTIEDPKDFEALGTQLDKIIYDTDVRRNCIEKGFLQASKFTWEKSAESVLKIYDEFR